MSNSLTKRADAQFKKQPRKLPWMEDISAQTEYEAAADALAEKISRLKLLRLARDAADRAAPPIAAKKPAKKPAKSITTKKQKKRLGVSLVDWLKNRQAAAST